MASWEDVDRLALSLPQAEVGTAHGNRAWRVRKKLFVWERPLRAGELEELGDAAPDGDVLGARVPDLGAKEAILADDPGVYFTTAHFEGSASVLVRLERIEPPELEELIVEAWLTRAGKRLSQKWEADSS